MQERNEDTLSLILDDPDSPPTFVFIFFVFFGPSVSFFPSRVPSPSVEQRIRERTNMRESRVCAPGCAGILGFIKFKTVTYGAATESGRDVEGVGREVMDRFYRES